MSVRPAAARTAFGPMVIAACEQTLPPHQRLFDDPDAIRMLPAAHRLIVGACRWRPAYRMLARATDRQARGLWDGLLCRKRYADDQVRAALADGIGQFLFLGAGFDTRSYRLIEPAGARSFETDLAATITDKRRRVAAAYGGSPHHTALIPLDLETGDLGAELAGAGFDGGARTMVVWEAVTQYLTGDGVRRTLSALSSLPPGSRLIFTYLRRDFLDGEHDYGAATARERFVVKHRIWRFGLLPAEVAGLLAGYGWTEREQLGPDEYAVRYPGPHDRDRTASPIERFVSADR
jgi:methyltransferase (TIGR00027 family)